MFVCLKAVKEIGKEKDQTQQYLCAGKQEQQNCHFLPFLLMGQFKINLSEQQLSSWQSALLPKSPFLLF